MDRCNILKQKIVDIAKSEDVKLVVVIGSQARTTDVADQYSDIDFIIVTDKVEGWLYGDIPQRLGDIKISFIEPTLGGGKERRVYIDDYLDVDLVVLTQEQFATADKDGIIGQIIKRGYQVLYDLEDYTSLLKEAIDCLPEHVVISEAEFNNMVNDFYFHIIWAGKKLYRGEIWSAKMCIDAYLKRYLLKVIEVYSHEIKGCDVWHDGRFLDKWAEPDIREALEPCFARYNREDMQNALRTTEKLFARLSSQVAEKLRYEYPEAAKEYAEQFLLKKEI